MTFTKERLTELSRRENVGAILGEEIAELARIALASLEAEPVGEVVLGEFDDAGCHPDARVACIAADGQADWENFKDGTRLYTAPPAPVSVPDEAIRSAVDEIMATYAGSADECRKLVRKHIEDACRAAMLQGADGNSPVIPDGWVVVPVEPTEEMNKAGWTAMNEHDAINPTYRAMLAAAPQQEADNE